jgi:hypothetical protein
LLVVCHSSGPRYAARQRPVALARRPVHPRQRRDPSRRLAAAESGADHRTARRDRPRVGAGIAGTMGPNSGHKLWIAVWGAARGSASVPRSEQPTDPTAPRGSGFLLTSRGRNSLRRNLARSRSHAVPAVRAGSVQRRCRASASTLTTADHDCLLPRPAGPCPAQSDSGMPCDKTTWRSPGVRRIETPYPESLAIATCPLPVGGDNWRSPG